ncbi:hypothetical protein A5648_01150 [Mycolicibacter sinensis]|uniref:Uncharacterized protein n=1 Tax=Mycolicibacter sinensis (strain JDM601) TaxID=875328 RepID=A0A1A3U0M6_MYCSD|nr:hypothetical protein A5648_01150 [Mycolicibacter sinensis]
MGDPARRFAGLEWVLDDVGFARVVTPILTEHAHAPVDGLVWVRELQRFLRITGALPVGVIAPLHRCGHLLSGRYAQAVHVSMDSY